MRNTSKENMQACYSSDQKKVVGQNATTNLKAEARSVQSAPCELPQGTLSKFSFFQQFFLAIGCARAI